MRVLIVEDDKAIAENLYDYLEGKGHRCDYAHSLVSARRLLAAGGWDAVLLDRNLPDGDGVSLLPVLAADGMPVPVLVLTARDQLDDKAVAFAAGSDDYLVKPFALQEVEMRLQALHRRTHRESGGPLVYGPLSYDPQRHEFRLSGELLMLPPKAARLLALLLRAPEQLHTREALEMALWGETQVTSDNLRSVLHIVRKALGETAGIELRNVHGLGYKLVLA